MYTVTYDEKRKNAATRQIELLVTVTNSLDGASFPYTFRFPLYTSLAQINRIVKDFVEELEAGDTLGDTIPLGSVDLSVVGSDVTPEKAAFLEFVKDVAKRERVQKLIDWAIIPDTSPKVVALNDKIKAALQTNPTFLDQI
jgi:hypothetical protein